MSSCFLWRMDPHIICRESRSASRMRVDRPARKALRRWAFAVCRSLGIEDLSKGVRHRPPIGLSPRSDLTGGLAVGERSAGWIASQRCCGSAVSPRHCERCAWTRNPTHISFRPERKFCTLRPLAAATTNRRTTEPRFCRGNRQPPGTAVPRSSPAHP